MSDHIVLLFVALTTLSVLLAVSELAIPTFQFRISDLMPLIEHRFVSRKKQQDVVQRNFLLLSGLRAELVSGATAHHALQFLVESQFANELSNTRLALETFSSVSAGLLLDSRKSRFEGLEQLSVAWELSQETGAPLAGLVEQIITTFEENEKRRALIQTETAGVKATVYVLAALPLIGMFLASMLGINVLAWYASGVVGFLSLSAGIVLEVIGILWVRRMIAHANPTQKVGM